MRKLGNLLRLGTCAGFLLSISCATTVSPLDALKGCVQTLLALGIAESYTSPLVLATSPTEGEVLTVQEAGLLGLSVNGSLRFRDKPESKLASLNIGPSGDYDGLVAVKGNPENVIADILGRNSLHPLDIFAGPGGFIGNPGAVMFDMDQSKIGNLVDSEGGSAVINFVVKDGDVQPVSSNWGPLEVVKKNGEVQPLGILLFSFRVARSRGDEPIIELAEYSEVDARGTCESRGLDVPRDNRPHIPPHSILTFKFSRAMDRVLPIVTSNGKELDISMRFQDAEANSVGEAKTQVRVIAGMEADHGIGWPLDQDVFVSFSSGPAGSINSFFPRANASVDGKRITGRKNFFFKTGSVRFHRVGDQFLFPNDPDALPTVRQFPLSYTIESTAAREYVLHSGTIETLFSPPELVEFDREASTTINGPGMVDVIVPGVVHAGPKGALVAGGGTDIVLFEYDPPIRITSIYDHKAIVQTREVFKPRRDDVKVAIRYQASTADAQAFLDSVAGVTPLSALNAFTFRITDFPSERVFPARITFDKIHSQLEAEVQHAVDRGLPTVSLTFDTLLDLPWGTRTVLLETPAAPSGFPVKDAKDMRVAEDVYVIPVKVWMICEDKGNRTLNSDGSCAGTGSKLSYEQILNIYDNEPTPEQVLEADRYSNFRSIDDIWTQADIQFHLTDITTIAHSKLSQSVGHIDNVRSVGFEPGKFNVYYVDKNAWVCCEGVERCFPDQFGGCAYDGADWAVVLGESGMGLVEAHEIGHGFGLSHSGDPANLMNDNAAGVALTAQQKAAVHGLGTARDLNAND